jgi:hypothetical protein
MPVRPFIVSKIDPELLQERLSTLEERRFSSVRLQLTSVTELGDAVSSILEVGPGSGYFSSVATNLGYDLKTADIKPITNPDYLGDFREIEVSEQFDLVAAFEMLQHIPYQELSSTLTKLASLSNRYVLISVPSHVHRFELALEIPGMLAPRRLGLGWLRGRHSLMFRWERPRSRGPSKASWEGREDYWNPHYWEVGRKNFPKSRFLRDIESSGLRVIWAKHNPRFDHHLFVLAEKTDS